MMHDLGAVVAIAAGVSGVTAAVGGCVRWIFRRGEESGKTQAKHVAERQAQAQAEAKVRTIEGHLAKVQAELGEVRAELDFIRTRRRRA